MALINETTLQRRLAALESYSAAAVAGESIEVVQGTLPATGEEGDVAFDGLTNQMYVYFEGAWVTTGSFIWTKYADEVNNIQSNGRVLDSADVIGGMYDNIQADTKWIGQALNQPTNVESNSSLDYSWSLYTGLITSEMVDGTKVPTAVTNIVITEELYQTNNASGVKNRVNLTWDSFANAGFEETVSVIIQSKPVNKYVCSNSIHSIESDCINNGGTWDGTPTDDSDYKTLVETPNNSAILPDVAIGFTDFRLYAASILGVRSAATIYSDFHVEGLTATPQSPLNLTLSSSEGQTLLTWDRSTELDVKSGGSVQIRIHPTVGINAQWSSALVLVDSLQGTTTSKTVPLLVGTYMIKFLDSGDRECLTPATVINSFAPTNFNFVSELDESSVSFSGVKTNCSLAGSDLKITSGQTEMEYVFSSVIDLGTIKNVRIVPHFEALIYNVGAEICDVVSVCDLTQLCTTQEDAIIRFEIQTSDDNVTFSGWKSLIAGNYSNRAFKFRVLATVGDTNTLISFSQLSASLDTVDLIQTGSVTTNITADEIVTFNTPFYIGVSGTTLPRIGLQTIAGSQGDEVIITDRTATTFEISVYNNGSRVVRNVDWQAIGQ